jgi:hypothetical protein
LTVVPLDETARTDSGAADSSGIRLACNRDESRLRPPALPPELRRFGNRLAVLPIDPASDGTWIAASDAGLAFVLMNVYGPANATVQIGSTQPPADRISRGQIIPHLLHSSNLAEAISLVGDLEHGRFEPFRLLIANNRELVEHVWYANETRSVPPRQISEPLFFTSSGLGDDVVANPRRRLFVEQFAPDADWIARQDAFHRHCWPDNPRASVWMTRPEAMTVSRTVVELGTATISMRYFARLGDSSDEIESQPMLLDVATA